MSWVREKMRRRLIGCQEVTREQKKVVLGTGVVLKEVTVCTQNMTVISTCWEEWMGGKECWTRGETGIGGKGHKHIGGRDVWFFVHQHQRHEHHYNPVPSTIKTTFKNEAKAGEMIVLPNEDVDRPTP